MIADVKAVADAVLYEGYILYPYRKTSLKNQQRWTFGGLFPRAYSARGGGDRCTMICECLVRGSEDARVTLQLRFLQIAARRIASLTAPIRQLAFDELPPHRIVAALEAGGRTYMPWDEAQTREDDLEFQYLKDLRVRPLTRKFRHPGGSEAEAIPGGDGTVEGLILRQTEDLSLQLTLSAERVSADVFRLRTVVENITEMKVAPGMKRDTAAAFSAQSTHLILQVQDGEFLSMTDPPQELVAEARTSSNDGCWPVLAGEDGATDTILAAPIILYDYPRIAPESQEAMFDGTEIDEILILRILTMTDAEKLEMASGDPRTRQMLARLESMTPGDLAKLHGTWRDTRAKPELVSVAHGGLSVGERVRLKPRRGGDILDIALAGKLAVIEAIERDFEDRIHIAVVVDDDPGRDFGAGRFPGHRFFFAPEEVEKVAEDAA